MKGRTRCPKCKHVFVLDIPDGKENYDAKCPRCENKFTIKKTGETCSENPDECYWEEHGEPRKTVLSSIKPKTNKPMIAMVLLICVCGIGISTAGFSEIFIETSLDAASTFGLDATVEFYVTNETNISISNVSVKIGDKILKTNENGHLKVKDINLGIQSTIITLPEPYNKSFNYEIMATPFFNSANHIKINESEIEDVDFNPGGCSIIILIFSLFAFLGALITFKREHFDAAMIMSFLGVFSFGFFLIGTILTVVALYFIYKSRDEFQNGKKGKVF